MVMLSAFISVKLAIEICNKPHIKREILCVHGSDYDVIKSLSSAHLRIKQWNRIIEKKAAVIIENLGMPKKLRKRIIGIVLSVAFRMYTWAKYHKETFGFAYEFSCNFLNCSFFTPRGLIDLKAAAIGLMYEKSLSIKQKYKLALMYSLNEHIPDLYLQMAEKDKEEFYDSQNPSRIRQPNFVKFWSYYHMGEIDKLRGDTHPDLYWLQQAIESGRKDTVEYCLQNTNLSSKEDVLLYAGLETIRNRMKIRFEPMVFWDQPYSSRVEETCVPNDHYIELIIFLFLKMKKDTQIKFLKADIKSEVSLNNNMRSKVLEYVLHWPYQDYFMKIARLMWDFLPERSYAKLLLRISSKFESLIDNLKYGEERHFDYKKLFREFWNESPELNKIYVFRDITIITVGGGIRLLNVGMILLNKLFRLKIFTFEDWKNIELILGSATKESKENIIFSEDGKEICTYLMEKMRWNTLDRFLSNCLVSEQQIEIFKKMFSCTEEARSVCINFMVNDEWNAVESFISWSSLPIEEINKLKKEMIYSKKGKDACVEILSYCKRLNSVDKAIRWCLHSESEITEFKKDFTKNMGSLICNTLITRCVWKKVCECEDNGIICSIVHPPILKFLGGQWEEVEKFLTWGFSAEEEIYDFKRQFLREEGDDARYCVKVLFHLIIANKWEEAEIFFAWLGLSFEEIKKLKEETALSSLAMSWINDYLNGHYRSLDCLGGKFDTIELILRWCLTDKEAVLEFRNGFDEVYGFKMYENSREELSEHKMTNLNELYLLVEELLNNLNQKSPERIMNIWSRNYDVVVREFQEK